MKSIGIVREVDCLGRVVLPMELRNMMLIDKGDPLEIFVDDKKIILKKFHIDCLFCGNKEELKKVDGKYICMSCLKELKKLDT